MKYTQDNIAMLVFLILAGYFTAIYHDFNLVVLCFLAIVIIKLYYIGEKIRNLSESKEVKE